MYKARCIAMAIFRFSLFYSSNCASHAISAVILARTTDPRDDTEKRILLKLDSSRVTREKQRNHIKGRRWRVNNRGWITRSHRECFILFVFYIFLSVLGVETANPVLVYRIKRSCQAFNLVFKLLLNAK